MKRISLFSRSSVRHHLACVGILAAMSVPGAPVAQPVGVPSMGSASSAELSPALERTLGDAIMEQGRRDPAYVADLDVSQYLTDLGRQLAARAPAGTAQHISIFALRDSQINAFALPGGYIGVNTGLVVNATTEAELASVVAHEIGHVSLRHIARGMTQQSQSSGIMMAALAGALLAALSGSGDLAMGVAAFGQAAAVDRQLGFSRQAEQEADRTGFEMMRKAGFDPRGMIRMFNRLMDFSRLNEGMGGGAYTSTHPLSIERMSDIENRVRGTPTTGYHENPSFWYIRAKLQVMQAQAGQAQRNAIQRLELDAKQASGVRQSAAWYGLAYAALRANDLAQARTALSQAQKGGQDTPELASLAVTLALQDQGAAKALPLAQAASSRWPENQGVALVQIQVMQKLGNDKEAVRYLQQRIKQWPDVPRLKQLLAQSHERLGERVEARRAMASYYEQTGALPTAVEQLQQARGMSRDFYVQSQIDVQIRDIKQRLDSDRELLKRFKKS
jgi:predicted Zn-dependent protease